MALQFLDRVRCFTATAGAGALAIGAAMPGFIGFAGMTVGNTSYYTIEDLPNWETGLGTLTAAGTWTRTTVINTSAGNTTPISLSGNANFYLTFSATAAGAIAAETARAQAAEALLAPATALTTETNRAQAAEALLAPKANPTFTGTAATPAVVTGNFANPGQCGVAWEGQAIGGVSGIGAINTYIGAGTGANYLSIGYQGGVTHFTMQYYNGGSFTTVGQITSTTTAATYATTSDYRLKQDVADLTGSANRIMSLRPVSFRFKSDLAAGDHYGFLAHEFAVAMGKAAGGVTGEKDEAAWHENAVVFAGRMIAQGVTEADHLAGVASGKFDARTTWHAEVSLPVYQGLDSSAAIPDLVATVQQLVRQQATLTALVAALTAHLT